MTVCCGALFAIWRPRGERKAQAPGTKSRRTHTSTIGTNWTDPPKQPILTIMRIWALFLLNFRTNAFAFLRRTNRTESQTPAESPDSRSPVDVRVMLVTLRC